MKSANSLPERVPLNVKFGGLLNNCRKLSFRYSPPNFSVCRPVVQAATSRNCQLLLLKSTRPDPPPNTTFEPMLIPGPPASAYNGELMPSDVGSITRSGAESDADLRYVATASLTRLGPNVSVSCSDIVVVRCDSVSLRYPGTFPLIRVGLRRSLESTKTFP